MDLTLTHARISSESNSTIFLPFHIFHLIMHGQLVQLSNNSVVCTCWCGTNNPGESSSTKRFVLSLFFVVVQSCLSHYTLLMILSTLQTCSCANLALFICIYIAGWTGSWGLLNIRQPWRTVKFKCMIWLEHLISLWNYGRVMSLPHWTRTVHCIASMMHFKILVLTMASRSVQGPDLESWWISSCVPSEYIIDRWKLLGSEGQVDTENFCYKLDGSFFIQ